MFDITSKSSFENLNHWLEDIKDNFDNPNLVLFGNKVDLEEKREVSKEEIEKFAKNNKIILKHLQKLEMESMKVLII